MLKPEIPTDNLYKFMAIGGLVSAISCVYFAVSLKRSLLEQVHQNHGVLAILRLETNLMAERTMRTEKISGELIDKTRAVSDDVHRKQANPSELNDQLQMLRSELEKLQGRIDQNKDDRLRVKTEVDKAENGVWYLEQHATEVTSLTRVLGVVGFVAWLWSLGGFWLWYSRIQKYVDQELKKKAQSEERAA